MMKSLRQLIPQLESNWLLPAWLLVAITTAAIAETWTIGVAVEQVYGLRTGWAIGGVVASAQAIGSLMWARAAQHNAHRTVRYKTIGPKGNKQRVEDPTRSEPALNVRAPIIVSITAGAISFGLGWALYASDGLITALDIALAFASPAGSIAAAMLNGIFTAGEVALDQWHIAQSEQRARPTRTSKRPLAHPTAYPPAHSPTLPALDELDKLGDITQSIASRLIELRERAHIEHQAGRTNGSFRRTDVQAWLDISKSYALAIINYGLEHQVLEDGERKYTYQFRN